MTLYIKFHTKRKIHQFLSVTLNILIELTSKIPFNMEIGVTVKSCNEATLSLPLHINTITQ